MFLLVDRHIELESEDLTKGVLRELLGSDLEDSDLLIGDSRLVVFVDVALKILLDVLDAVLLHEVVVGIPPHPIDRETPQKGARR